MGKVRSAWAQADLHEMKSRFQDSTALRQSLGLLQQIENENVLESVTVRLVREGAPDESGSLVQV